LFYASGEVGLEVSTEKTKYMVVSRHQNVGQNLVMLKYPLKMWQNSSIW